MFDFSKFIHDGLLSAVENNQARFVVTERAGAWMEKGVLTEEQVQAVSDALDERDAREEAEREQAEADALAAKYAEWVITEEGLSEHTIAELQEYMDDHGIDRAGCDLKADYISAIIGAD